MGVAEDALAAIEARDWDRLRPLLHPYVHWDGMRGRKNVLAFLAESPPPSAPESVELRDGQIYRWSERVAR